MIRRSCADNHVFEVSDMEISLQGPSYTVNTLEVFSKDKSLEPHFILGTDSLREIQHMEGLRETFLPVALHCGEKAGTGFHNRLGGGSRGTSEGISGPRGPFAPLKLQPCHPVQRGRAQHFLDNDPRPFKSRS